MYPKIRKICFEKVGKGACTTMLNCGKLYKIARKSRSRNAEAESGYQGAYI